MVQNRKKYSQKEKAKIALEALKGKLTLNEISSKFEVHSSQIIRWKKQLQDGIEDIFSIKRKKKGYDDIRHKEKLYEIIGRQKTEIDWLKKNLSSLNIDKRQLIDHNHEELSVRQQCELLEVSRSSVYYKPSPIDAETVNLMNLVDEIYTMYPFFGKRRMKAHLLTYQGIEVGLDKLRTIYCKLGLEAIYPKPNLSLPNKAHKIFPYLLKGLEITRTDQVWSTDITCIKLKKGCVYLVAIIDWYSRYVLDWSVSITLEADFCIETLQRCLLRSRCEIFNTDQGSQFTSNAFVSLLLAHGIQISMDGKGRALDNIFVERLWRSLKYECVYLKDFETVEEAIAEIKAYFEFYNNIRLHQTLEYKTPAEVYFENRQKPCAFDEILKKGLRPSNPAIF